MASIAFIGRLTRDPEIRQVGDTQVAKLAVADMDRFRSKPGTDPDPLYHDVEVWGGQAQVAENILRKGQRVYVFGQLVPNNYTSSKTGELVKANIVKGNFTLVESKAEASGTGAAAPAPMTDEIPF